jgi:hypothetical protein
LVRTEARAAAFTLSAHLGQGLGGAGRRGGLAHAVDRAQLQRAQGHLGPGLGQAGDHDHRHRPQAHDLLEELDAVHVRHLDVEGDDVGVQGLDHAPGLERVAGGADHLDLGVTGQGGRDQAPHGGGVVDDEDANLGHQRPTLR